MSPLYSFRGSVALSALLDEEEDGEFHGTVILRNNGQEIISGCNCPNDWLFFADFYVRQEQNGNLVVVQRSEDDTNDTSTLPLVLWSSNVSSSSSVEQGDYVTTLQSDCNLVTRRKSTTSSSSSNDTILVWSSETAIDDGSASENNECFWGLTSNLEQLQIWQGTQENATQLFLSVETQQKATTPQDPNTLPKDSSSLRPNILLITTDDMNWDSVGVYGCPVEETTPHIDQLARQGMQFDYGFVNIAVCTPSRHVILSGSHSHQTMTRGFTKIERVGPAIPDVLKENGYYTVEVNKQQEVYEWDRTVHEIHTGYGRDISFHQAFMPQVIQTAADANKPWFVVYNLNDPHRPYFGSTSENKYPAETMARFTTPSRVYNASDIVVPGFLPDLPDVRTEMAQYYSSVRRADDGVGALLAALEDSGQANRTVVVFLSDNGISNPFAKLSCYQNSLRVPFLLRYPGHIEAGARDSFNMVSAVDLAPTLLELVGLSAPPTMAGRSFVPLLQGNAQEGRDHVIGYYYRNVLSEVMYPMFVVQMRDWMYIYSPWVDGVTEVSNSDFRNGLTLQAMWAAAETVPSIKSRTEFHKYRIREELYNIRQDPHAYVNVAADAENRERVGGMRQLLVEWMEETDHPAKELMKDPNNEDLIANYMAWEIENAQSENLDEGRTLAPGGRSSTRGSGMNWRSALLLLFWLWTVSCF